MKIAMIGCSGHKNYVLDTLQEGMAICGYAPGTKGEDMTPLQSHQALEDAVYYQDWRTLLDEQKPDIVINNTWYGLAAPITLYALERNFHVFAEKPLAGTEEELDALERLWHTGTSFLGGMFGISYEPPLQTAFDYLQKTGIGEIRLMNAQKSYKLGTRADFYKDRQTYTGTIPWVGSHGIDWIYRFGGKKFQEVTAYHTTLGNHRHGSLEAAAVCTFKLEEDIFATLSIDYLRPAGAETHGDDRLRVVGTEGILEVKGGKVTIIDENGTSQLPLVQAVPIFPRFCKAIRCGEGRREWGHHAFYVTNICLKSRLSADKGKTIPLRPEGKE